jgi:hypothetical protein
VAVIAMGMGDDHAVEAADFRRQQLLAQVRTAVDQHALAGALDEDRAPQAIIARLLRIAQPPLVPDLGDASRRPAA